MQHLRNDIFLDNEPLRPAGVEWLNEAQLRVTLTEGRHRQIRRMCALVGWQVTAIKRVRIGSLRLGGLAVGNWSALPEAAARDIYTPQKLGAPHLHTTHRATRSGAPRGERPERGLVNEK